MVYDFRVWFKNRYGATFPELTPLVLPSTGQIKFYRQDLPDEEIRRNLLFLLDDLRKTSRHVSAIELAKAVHNAWPGYRQSPSDATDSRRGTVQ